MFYVNRATDCSTKRHSRSSSQALRTLSERDGQQVGLQDITSEFYSKNSTRKIRLQIDSFSYQIHESRYKNMIYTNLRGDENQALHNIAPETTSLNDT